MKSRRPACIRFVTALVVAASSGAAAGQEVWPPAFPAIETSSESAWRDDTVDFESQRIQLAYPDAWTIRKNARTGEVLALQNGDGSMVITMMAIAEAVARSTPLEPAKLRDFAEYMKSRTDVRGAVESARVGQARTADRLWLWHEARIPKVDLSKTPPAARAAAAERIGGVTSWTFITAAPPRAFAVMCGVLHPPGVPDTTIDEQQREAGAVFFAFLRRLSIAPR